MAFIDETHGWRFDMVCMSISIWTHERSVILQHSDGLAKINWSNDPRESFRCH